MSLFSVTERQNEKLVGTLSAVAAESRLAPCHYGLLVGSRHADECTYPASCYYMYINSATEFFYHRIITTK